MTIRARRWAAFLVFSGVLSSRLARAVSETLVPGAEVTSSIGIDRLKTQDGTVSGILLNRSGRTVRDVRLLIRQVWLWKNERHPGDDSPGRVDFYTVPNEIPAGGSVPFQYQPSPPLPRRSDGRFKTEVEVVGFTESGA